MRDINDAKMSMGGVLGEVTWSTESNQSRADCQGLSRRYRLRSIKGVE